MDNIFLIGMPGCGKTTIAKELAKILGYAFLDADEVIVKRAGKTIPELFAVSEEHFRDAEHEAMVYLSKKEKTIIACGGGVIKRRENMTAIQKTGKVFFINRPLKDIIASVETSTRPLLKDGKAKCMCSMRTACRFILNIVIM